MRGAFDTRGAAPPAPPPLLRQPEFLKLWAAQSISMLGDQVTLLALPLTAVLTLDASAAQMGFLVAAELMPHLLFSLFAGVFIERAQRRRRLMIGEGQRHRRLQLPHLLLEVFLRRRLLRHFSSSTTS